MQKTKCKTRCKEKRTSMVHGANAHDMNACDVKSPCPKAAMLTASAILALLVISLIIFSQFSYASSSSSSCLRCLNWSEILFNPIGNDNGKEYVELIDISRSFNQSNDSLQGPLDGCRISDSSSSDLLIRLNPDNYTSNNIIMIVENDSYYQDLLLQQNNTVYVIGSAIGNGLGNTNDVLRISCNNQTIIETSYSIDSLGPIKEGDSIVYLNDSWILGVQNGTPGTLPSRQPASGSSDPAGNKDIKNNSANDVGGSGGGGGVECLQSIHLSASRSHANPGDAIEIELLAPEYASLEAKDSSGNTLLFKDTFEGTRFVLLVPETRYIQLTAIGNACGAQQRMRKTIIVSSTSSAISESPASSGVASNNKSLRITANQSSSPGQADAVALFPEEGAVMRNNSDGNASITRFGAAQASSTNGLMRGPAQESQGEALLQRQEQENADDTNNSEEGTPSGDAIKNVKNYKNVLYDSNSSALVWVCIFGVTVIAVCGMIFAKLLKSGAL